MPDWTPMLNYLASVWPVSTALIISLLLELTVTSKAEHRAKPALAILLHMMIFFAFYSLFFLLCRRLIFTGILVILGQLVLVVISNAKYKALREPLVASDLILFTQALRHPRLYFPFLGLAPMIILPLALLAATWLMIALEPATVTLNGLMELWLPLVVTMVMIILSAALLAYLLEPTLKPDIDVARYGMIANLVVYIVHAIRSKINAGDLRSSLEAPNVSHAEHAPHIVVVQSESFFDLRPRFPDIKSEVLNNYDHCKSRSRYQGTLEVPAWGAYTMRTEFSFLTGIGEQDLGFAKFDPYQAFKSSALPSIASILSDQGYHSVCIHPNAPEFFSRHKMFPNLGFDEFIDISQFDDSQKSGPYIGDAAITEKIRELMHNATRPLFIFAITMENHGPLHLEKATPEDIERFYESPPPNDYNDLTVYLRHLANADQMIGQLCEYFSSREQQTCFCWYGDHVPSMPDVYAHIGFEDSHTDYFIWTGQDDPATSRPLSVESLGGLLLSCAFPESNTALDSRSPDHNH